MTQILYIAGAITTISAALVILYKVHKWGKKVFESEKCQLRHIMLHTYYKHKDEKKVRQYEFENFEIAYGAYKALGGNSFIDLVYREVHEWEIIT